MRAPRVMNQRPSGARVDTNVAVAGTGSSDLSDSVIRAQHDEVLMVDIDVTKFDQYLTERSMHFTASLDALLGRIRLRAVTWVAGLRDRAWPNSRLSRATATPSSHEPVSIEPEHA